MTINISCHCFKQSLNTKLRTQTNHALLAVFLPALGKLRAGDELSSSSDWFLEMWASVVIGHKKPRENHLLWFYDTRRLCWRYSVQKITSTFLTELPRFQSKPLPSMPSANSAQRQLNLGTFSLRYLTACYPPIPPSKNGRYQRTPETNCFFKISCLITVVVVYFELGHQRILSGKTKCQKTTYWGGLATKVSKKQ